MDENIKNEANAVSSKAESPWRDRAGIAAHFGRSLRCIGNWQRKKVIPFVKQGGNVLFHIHKCEEALLKGYEVKSISGMARQSCQPKARINLSATPGIWKP